MPEDSGGGEKTEDPTPKKIEDARQEGQVSVSAEVTTTVGLILGFCMLILIGPMFLRSFSSSMRHAFSESILWEFDFNNIGMFFKAQFGDTGLYLMIFASSMFIITLSILIGQVGLKFYLKPLIPKFSKLNPVSGIKRILGMRGIMKFVFNLSKLVIVVFLAWYFISDIMLDALYFKVAPIERMVRESYIVIELGITLAASIAAIAFGDFLYQRHQHHKDLMMTKQEVKDEMKQSEGDPLLKQKIRQVQRQMAQQRMMEEVPKADVVITNPTHVAVALQYDTTTMNAPVCVAKGYDAIAQRIKKIASENDIIQVENVPLARALAKQVEIGKAVPVDFYHQVAEVLSYVYKLKNKK